MKKLRLWQKAALLTIVLLTIAWVFLGVALYAEEQWVTANEKTISWDPVTSLEDGTPIPPEDTVTYKISVCEAVTRDKTEVASGIEATTWTVILPHEGRFYICAQATRHISGTTEVMHSAEVCTDNPQYCEGDQSFGVIYYLSPDWTLPRLRAPTQ